MRHWGRLAALVCLVPCIAQGQRPVSLTGAVFDSLVTERPLANATVVVVELARYTTTDSAGRFRFDSLPPGRFSVTFQHPVLDRLGAGGGTSVVALGAGSDRTIALATPSFGTLYRSTCHETPDERRGVLFGRTVAAASDRPIAAARTSAVWRDEIALDSASRPTLRENVGASNAVGFFVVCGVPRRGVIALAASTSDARSGTTIHTLTGERIAAVRLRLASSVDSSSASARLTFVNPSGAPIPRVTVSDFDTRRTLATSGLDGIVQVAQLGAGSRTLEARAVGFTPTFMSADFAPGGRRDSTLMLQPIAQSLDPVSVAAANAGADKSGFNERMKAGVGRFLTQNKIQAMGATDVVTILARVPALQLERQGGKYVISMRGGGSGIAGGRSFNGRCAPSIFIDDIPTTLADARDQLEVGRIAGIEVYTSGEVIPARFDNSSRTACGSIVIWTKP